MKYYLRFFIALFLSLVIITPVFGQGKKQEAELEIELSKLIRQKDSLNNVNENLRSSLAQEEEELKSNKELLNSLKNKIAKNPYAAGNANTIQDEINSLDSKLAGLKGEMVLTAVKFLQTPYDEIGIRDFALDAYERGKGTENYIKYQTQYRLLQNYGKDLSELRGFLQSNMNKITNATVGSTRDSLRGLRLYKGYQSLGPDEMGKTYIGKIVKGLEDLLNDPDVEDSKLKTGFLTYYNQVKDL